MRAFFLDGGAGPGRRGRQDRGVVAGSTAWRGAGLEIGPGGGGGVLLGFVGVLRGALGAVLHLLNASFLEFIDKSAGRASAMQYVVL